ncbi:hypothetical protein SPSYN_00031 [Sporotomaculum syntrophicum]|uniref:Uncharacterized protein n=1 Tax=Sporotomaculum syntrophicum TaxID=182264 RepID=A0A9D2WS12_9FIRM|nr:hypothetical protein [Sporotomaculum syntrophicum]KAF1086314.1 hypothetical protein SPSYN_00031 [Sporotomaculum syntrophicum]
MKKRSNIDTVLDMVEAFLKGNMSRIDFQLDFPYEVQQHYQKMAREDEEFARLIDERLVEDGVYKGERLSDEAFRELIQKQFLDVVDISDEGYL